MNIQQAQLIAFAEHRVCPLPGRWHELYELLPADPATGRKPALPLILAARHHTSDDEKRHRLRKHLEWAERHGALAAIIPFMQSLNSDDWHLESN